MTRPIIEVERISKCYRLGAIGPTSLRETFSRYLDRLQNRSVVAEKRDFWALREVSFDVQAGEVVGIIGRNGAGKSTLLKILSRITEPTSGRAVIRGRVASLLEVGTGFHPELSGRENIFLNGAILGMTRAEVRRKFKEIVAFAEVEQFIDTPVKRYSSGMYVRLAFAVAAHLEPDILIVDEVLAVGDAQFQEKCLGKMQSVSTQGGRTVLFVSHNMAAIQRLCKQSIVLQQGQLAFKGPTKEAAACYLNSSTKELNANVDGYVDLESQPQAGSGSVRFISIRLVDSAGSPLHACAIAQTAVIEIAFKTNKNVSSLIIGFAVHDALGQPIFATHWNDYGKTYSLTPGIWNTRCIIEPNYLRAGTYNISLGAITASETCAHIPEAFRLKIESLISSKLSYYDNRIGQLFIPMKWQEPKKQLSSIL